ncbi:MAG: 50S ribosomal protein L32 [Patescibacteria group bacterium]
MPKKRLTSTRSGNRKSHDSLSAISLAKCEKCHEPVKPHNVCKNCGTYRGKTIIDLDKKSEAPIQE